MKLISFYVCMSISLRSLSNTVFCKQSSRQFGRTNRLETLPIKNPALQAKVKLFTVKHPAPLFESTVAWLPAHEAKIFFYKGPGLSPKLPFFPFLHPLHSFQPQPPLSLNLPQHVWKGPSHRCACPELRSFGKCIPISHG